MKANYHSLRRAGLAVLDNLFPPHCALCQERTEHFPKLCAECTDSLLHNQFACLRCALPLHNSLPGNQCGPPQRICYDCQTGRYSFDRVVAPLIYETQIAGLISRWKYQREVTLTPVLAALWLSRAMRAPVPDIIIPVPLHWQRLVWRGFNQAERLAWQLALRHPELERHQVWRNALRRRRRTAVQAGLAQRRRSDNMEGAFTLHKPCDNLHVAVVDDVCTTGATVDAVARCLKAAGARRVDVWCIARTPAPG